MKELYWIRGVEGRELEVLDILEEKGGEINNFIDVNSNFVYFIDNNGIITRSLFNEGFGQVIRYYGTELHLPEKKQVLSWDDVEECPGYCITGCTIIERLNRENLSSRKSKSVFATEQQAKSAQAAAMISQIREHGKDVYGNIVELGKSSIIIKLAPVMHEPSINNVESHEEDGGLLRFSSIKQAKLFLDNNWGLVEEYLKTF